nr:ataxin 1 [Hymenolepis microstoma]
MFTQERLNAIKAATASCGLFASLITHSQKKHFPSITPPLPNTHRSSSLSTSSNSSIPSKKSLPSFFKRGTRVRLVNRSIQEVERLRIANFFRAVESLGTESNLQWVEPSITLDCQCNKEQTFFVQSHGWSSCDPQSTLSRFGLPCRPLSVGDLCLVAILSEIVQ